MSSRTYGESMQQYERLEDERYWERRYYKALNQKDYNVIEQLIKEAFEENFLLPQTQDSKIIEIIERLRKKA